MFKWFYDVLSWLSNLSDENILKLVGFLGAILAFILALRQYRSGQQWKKTEFLALEYKKFIDDPFVSKAFIMLDNYTISIPVSKAELDGINDNIAFTPSLLDKALTDVADETKRPKWEVYIRLCIDKFLFKLGIFQNYIDAKAITEKQADGYLLYWIDLIGNKDNNIIGSNTRQLLHEFIKKYNYSSTIKLVNSHKKCEVS
jgi:hypothetical protein